MAQNYGLVLGQGRSGTNWVVDNLDISPRTFCRNEPDLCAGSAFSHLPEPWRIRAASRQLASLWDQAVEQTSTHMGEFDHRLNNPKMYVRGLSQRTGVAQLSARPKARRALSTVVRSWRQGEWPMPPWVGTLDNEQIFSVFKLVQTYNWAAWVLENRPSVPVVHVVRHPGGRHDSFLRRYVAFEDAEKIRRNKIDQLRVLAAEGDLGARMGSIDDLTLEEAETWFGIYQMEVLENVAAANPRYLRVLYEDMVFDPADTIESIYAHFGLPVTPDVQRRIEEQRTASVFGGVSGDAADQAYGWRDRLDSEVTTRIENIVERSAIAPWWTEGDSAARQAA